MLVAAYATAQAQIAGSTRRPRPAARRRYRAAITGLIFVFLFLAFGSRSARAAVADHPPEIVLGMSTALTGSAQNLGKDMQRGILAGLDRVNRNGGVNGHKLRLITLDDGYEPARTGPNMRQLIEKDNVLAIIGNVGTPTAIVAVPVANEEKMLALRPVLRRSGLAQRSARSLQH